MDTSAEARLEGEQEASVPIFCRAEFRSACVSRKHSLLLQRLLSPQTHRQLSRQTISLGLKVCLEMWLRISHEDSLIFFFIGKFSMPTSSLPQGAVVTYIFIIIML